MSGRAFPVWPLFFILYKRDMAPLKVLSVIGFAALALVASNSLLHAQQDKTAAGKEAFERACTACHPAEVATSLKMTKEQWSSVVDDMVGRGADANEKDQAAIVEYLTANFGAKKQ